MTINEEMKFKLVSFGSNQYGTHLYLWNFETYNKECPDCGNDVEVLGQVCFLGFSLNKNYCVIYLLGHEFAWRLRNEKVGAR